MKKRLLDSLLTSLIWGVLFSVILCLMGEGFDFVRTPVPTVGYFVLYFLIWNKIPGNKKEK